MIQSDLAIYLRENNLSAEQQININSVLFFEIGSHN